MRNLPWEKRRDLVTKVDEATDSLYGCSPFDRSIPDYINYGLINLDKPSGPSSHEVVAWVKRILGLKRAGHGGTLDPRVTGVLPIALGEATKVVGTFLLSGKEYVCVMRLHDDVPEKRVRSVIEEFVGEIFQRPPLRSSVKRSVRLRTIYYIDDVAFFGRRVLFKVGCQAGTYIRKLVYDVGEALGSGAHMEELRRTRAGSLSEEKDLISLYDLKYSHDLWVNNGDQSMLRSVIMPIENALELIPKIYVRDSAIASICHGAMLALPGIAKLETGIKVRDIVALLSLKGELVALGNSNMCSETMIKRDHGIAVNTKRVIMDLKTYPKFWHSRKNVKE